MIIRKPFAFLVEKFKLIHFIVLIPCIYLIYMFWRVSNFFNSFVVNGYVTNISELVSKYYSFLMIIACIIVIAFTILVFLLFKRKNLFYIPYLFLCFTYIVILVITIYLPALLYDAEMAELQSSTSLIVRGVMNIAFYIQIISSVLLLFLTFGFNIKTGEFSDIKDEINLDEEDSEEVEINIRTDNYKVKRFVNRYIREVKYYVIENKNIFKILAGILGVIILFFAGKFILSLNRIVRVDQSFGYSNFLLSFNDSLLSTLDYSGNRISKGKIYLANKLIVTNKTNGLQVLKTDDFCLNIEGECIYPILDKSGKFIDLAKPYYAEKIGGGQQNEIVLVYELEEAMVRSKYKIKVLDSLTYKKDDVIAKYKEITLSPAFSDSVRDIGLYSLNDEINLSKTTMLNTTLNISDYELSQYFRYNYDYCYLETCSLSTNAIAADFGKYFVILTGKINLDENASYTKYKLGSNDFFSDFTKIEYTKDGKKYLLDVKDITPKKVEDKIVLETNSSVRNADSINLIITIRDKRYTLKLE